MRIFDLPKSTEFGRVIPKNSFDEFTNSKQKKIIADSIQRITWTNKLSKETTNLQPGSVAEIQVIRIELKQRNDLKKILDMFDKSIPYHIVFVLIYENKILLSTSAKHNHITKANESVIDCTFKTSWTSTDDFNIKFNLKESLDRSFISLCSNVIGRNIYYSSYTRFVDNEVKIISVEKKIKNLESQIKREKQFNKQVDLNMEMDNLKSTLTQFL